MQVVLFEKSAHGADFDEKPLPGQTRREPSDRSCRRSGASASFDARLEAFEIALRQRVDWRFIRRCKRRCNHVQYALAVLELPAAGLHNVRRVQAIAPMHKDLVSLVGRPEIMAEPAMLASSRKHVDTPLTELLMG